MSHNLNAWLYRKICNLIHFYEKYRFKTLKLRVGRADSYLPLDFIKFSRFPGIEFYIDSFSILFEGLSS